MTWQGSLNKALVALRKEETRIVRELDALRTRIANLMRGGAGSRGTRKAPGTRRMSAKGRAAISRAAKKRWAAYRKAKGTRA